MSKLVYLARRATQLAQMAATIRRCNRHIKRFGRRPVLVIVGARDGVRGFPWILAKRGLLDVVGFEPDEGECVRLRQLQPYARFEPWALGDADRRQPFYITAHPGCSSCLEPDTQVLARYPIAQWFKVERKVEVMIHRFDHLCPSKVDLRADYIQMDVQGFETKILEGFGKHLSHVIGVQSEGHFRPLYRNQSLLWEQRDLLERHGLVLRQIRPEGGAFEGEVVETEIWFSRREEEMNDEQRSLLDIWERMCFLAPPAHFTANDAESIKDQVAPTISMA